MTFQKVYAHDIVLPEFLLSTVVWPENHWCAECITEPLFDIHDRYICELKENFHAMELFDICRERTFLTNINGHKVRETLYNDCLDL